MVRVAFVRTCCFVVLHDLVDFIAFSPSSIRANLKLMESWLGIAFSSSECSPLPVAPQRGCMVGACLVRIVLGNMTPGPKTIR